MSRMYEGLENLMVASPKQLNYCAEFQIDSRATAPHLCGPIDVRVEPDKLGVRWSGEKTWSWVEWHELIVFADNPGPLVRELVNEERERGYREGLEEAIKEHDPVEALKEFKKSKVIQFPLSPESA